MNKCKVELYNTDGSLAHSEEKHNYVTKGYLSQIENYAKNLIYGGFGFGGTQHIVNNTLLNINITNNTDAIDTNNGVFDDVIVGWADLSEQYAGTDTLTGTTNYNESCYDGTTAKIVIDFGTDKGNGTFQTIHTSNGKDTFERAILPMVSIKNFSDIVGSSNIIMCTDSTYLYIAKAQIGINNIYRFNKTTLAYVSTIALSQAVNAYDITSDGSYLYFCNGTNSSAVIYKYLLSGTFQGSHDTGGSYLYGIDYFNSKLYLNQQSIATINTDFTGLATIGGGGTNDTQLTNDGVNLYSNTATFSSIYRSTKKVDPSDGSTIWNYTTASLYGICYFNGDLFASNSGMHKIDTDNPFNVATRVLLDSPVTKNDTQTMKITYTFNFS